VRKQLILAGSWIWCGIWKVYMELHKISEKFLHLNGNAPLAKGYSRAWKHEKEVLSILDLSHRIVRRKLLHSEGGLDLLKRVTELYYELSKELELDEESEYSRTYASSILDN